LFNLEDNRLVFLQRSGANINFVVIFRSVRLVMVDGML